MRRASASSMRAWIPPIQAWESASTGLIAALARLCAGREGLEHVALEHLHLLLRGFEPPLAEARQLQAALVRGERLLERKLAALHARDDLLQLGERFLETQAGLDPGRRGGILAGGLAHGRTLAERASPGQTSVKLARCAPPSFPAPTSRAIRSGGRSIAVTISRGPGSASSSIARGTFPARCSRISIATCRRQPPETTVAILCRNPRTSSPGSARPAPAVRARRGARGGPPAPRPRGGGPGRPAPRGPGPGRPPGARNPDCAE